ncbi:MAG: Gfo/Idh/MocA family oxidoreductase [Oceanospirillaceae bacterium]
MQTDQVNNQVNTAIGIGVIGGGYMGKRHAVAMQSVGALCNTTLRPVCEMICTTTAKGAALKAQQFGFKRSTDDWQVLVNDPAVEAIIIASPQETHLAICSAAFALGKPVLCEKPLGASLSDATKMTELAAVSQCINMVGFNYIRTPLTQYAKQLIEQGMIGDVTYFRGEHSEDFYADPNAPASWRTQGRANGTMGDLAPHMINAAIYLLGPIEKLCAQIETVHATRPNQDKTQPAQAVTNDDQAQFICKFAAGASGHLAFSRVASGRKMGLIYEITGTKGAIRFDQEDQNALWLYQNDQPLAQQGFRKILSNPEHPDYALFCEGPGHGTGYQDQLILEARDFLQAIETGGTQWPVFADGLATSKVVDAAWRSQENAAWVDV